MANAQRFWVLGGEYRSMAFDEMVEGSQRLYGPIRDRREAETVWRRVSEENRHRGAVRFAIVSEASPA
ncbi:MAG: hypothetical protein KGI57_09045 [Hyphomicrobiales bacterium]|nr:hypothetical protein [Hyphomicrobiales bacterium]MDE2017839.1 hypothetical protein [Hyphomicrobiales bacterium]